MAEELGSAPTAAALVIRVWRETPDSPAIKARIIQRPDLDTDEEITTTASGPEEIYDEVRAWLESFLTRSRQDGSR
ncbi:MAG TPA: hypothetical protein VFT31_03260 [Kribbella sp.]|nr:hypothetical protein [Kribbella sp.]